MVVRRIKRPLPILILFVTTSALAQDAANAQEQPPVESAATPEGHDTFAKQALTLVQQGNVADYTGLIPSMKQLLQWCAGMVGEQGEDTMRARLDKLAQQTQENLSVCKKLDWSKAKPIKTTGGEFLQPVPGCTHVTQIKDFKFYFEIESKTYRVKLDDPFVRDGKHFGFLGDPECSLE